MATLPPLASPPASSSSQPPATPRTRSSPTLHSLSLLQKSSSARDLAQVHVHLLKSSSLHDPLVLNKLLSLYASSHPENSISLFVDSIREDPLCLNSHAFPPVLGACAKISAGFEGTQIHGRVVKLGFVGDIYVQNSLIQMYFGCWRREDACKLFDGMSERSVVSWNCLIGGYASMGLWKDVIALFKRMVGEESVVPNSVTLVRAVTACSRLGDVETGRWIHWYIAENEVLLGLNLGNALVNMYARFGDMEEARRLFDRMDEHDVVSWTTLVTGYASVGDIGCARRVFNEMPVRNVVAWNAMIAGYVQNGCYKEAMWLYEAMLVLDVKIDKATLVSVLSACARSGDLFSGKVVHGYISKIGISMTIDLLHSILGLYSKCKDVKSAELLFSKMRFRNEISWTLMIVGYVACGAKEIALDLFREMPCKDVASWNALITILAQCNHFDEALDVFEQMQEMKVTPNCLTLVSALSACARVGALELGIWIHAYIERNNIKLDVQLSSSLIDMYARCGCVELSLDVFSKSDKDLLTWSTMIGGLAAHGQNKLAFGLFHQMEDYGIHPDAITFLGILSACSHAGLVEEGKYYYNLMTQTYGISPTAEHYCCMVDLFCRLDLLREAKDFIDRISVSANEKATLGALLSAGNRHGNTELAEYAASRVFEMDPTNSGAYVLLSNTYAKVSEWVKVGELRKIMKIKGIEKVPGCSSIEINGVVHEFFVGDASNPDSREIYMMLDGLEMVMKES